LRGAKHLVTVTNQLFRQLFGQLNAVYRTGETGHGYETITFQDAAQAAPYGPAKPVGTRTALLRLSNPADKPKWLRLLGPSYLGALGRCGRRKGLYHPDGRKRAKAARTRALGPSEAALGHLPTPEVVDERSEVRLKALGELPHKAGTSLPLAGETHKYGVRQEQHAV
jgi:hypothetical protein